MMWPWGKNITDIQAMEIGKFCLNLCQATLIGTLGVFYISGYDVFVRVILIISGMAISVVLFLFAVKLFEGGKEYEILE